MANKFKRLISLSVYLSLIPTISYAHGDLHDRIVAVTEKITRTPENVALYVERANLLRMHQQYDEALVDIIEIERLDPNYDSLLLLKGFIYHDAGWHHTARHMLTAFCQQHADAANAHLVLAKSCLILEDAAAAAYHYDQAIPALKRLQPQSLIEQAEAYELLGDLETAIERLDAGMDQLGSIHIYTLQRKAVDIEIAMESYDEALERIANATEHLDELGRWHFVRARVLVVAGYADEAEAAITAAQAWLDRLPEDAQKLPHNVEERRQLNALSDQLTQRKTRVLDIREE